MSTADPAVVSWVLLEHRRAWLNEFAAIADASSPTTHQAPITWEAFLRRGGIQAATTSSSEQPTAAIPAVALVSGTGSPRGSGEFRGGHRGRGNSDSRGSPRGRGEWAWRAGQRYRIRGRGGRQQQPRADPGIGSSAGASGDPPREQNQPQSGTQLGTVPMQRARPVVAPPASPPADILAELSLDPINWWDILAAARNPPAPELAQEGAGPWRQPGPAPAARRVLPDPFDIPTPIVSTVPPSDTSLNELAEDASILLELFSQSSHPDNNISDEHRDLITSAAASISAIQGRVGQTAAPGNRGTRPRQGMEAGADCIICYAETADTVFLPCKHLVVCTVRLSGVVGCGSG